VEELRRITGGRIDRAEPRAFPQEHETHASARFSSSVAPPATRGTTWSTWNVASWPACASRQYSHRSPARSRTRRCNEIGIWRSLIPASGALGDA
jgi:hypothetical protein